MDSLTTNIQLGEFVQGGEDFETLSGDHTGGSNTLASNDPMNTSNTDEKAG